MKVEYIDPSVAAASMNKKTYEAMKARAYALGQFKRPPSFAFKFEEEAYRKAIEDEKTVTEFVCGGSNL